MDYLPTIRQIKKWDEKPDLEIWTSLKNDDKSAYAYIYNRYIGDLYNYGMKIFADDDFVSETIQELFLEIWRSRHNQSNVTNIKLYLLKSLRYKLFRETRKKKKITLLDIQNLPKNISIVPPYEDDLINDEDIVQRKHKLAAKINQLPDRQREIIHFIFYENFSYEKTAELMNINLRSVYTLTWKAISNLRKLVIELSIIAPLIIGFA